MAKSPAHRFGQIIGDLLEETLIDYCKPFVEKYGMYLDYKHSRKARDGKSEVQWEDVNGNKHKLDIVIEENGTEIQFGKPRAFIEIAWRRYTKHSKNKAQEISGAIRPLISKYSTYCPFFGAVLAGEFTENSLKQLKSEGFKIVYFSMNEIEKAFASQGIYAHWEEDTSEEELERKIKKYEELSSFQTQQIAKMLLENNKEQLQNFFECLENALQRRVVNICVMSLYGFTKEFPTALEACQHISEEVTSLTLKKEDFYEYNIVIKYSNNDKIEMKFKDQQMAIITLMSLI